MLQKIVFWKQLELTAKWSRPMSIHLVNMHKHFMEVLQDVWRDDLKRNEEEDDNNDDDRAA